MAKFWRKFPKPSWGTFYFILGMAAIGIIWHFVAIAIDQSITLPRFGDTMQTFWSLWTDQRTMTGLGISLMRILRGFGISVAIGLPLGLLMGYSKIIRDALSPLIHSIRQVPIMAWIPIAISWFGIAGGGPTIFIIVIATVFPITLNTIAGISNIDPNFINAAKSMGASTPKIFLTIILPGSLPNFLVGCRLGLGLAWFSVICAEFIATSEGFGFQITEAMQMVQPPRLFALILMSGVVGYFMDRILAAIERLLTSWRFKNAA